MVIAPKVRELYILWTVFAATGQRDDVVEAERLFVWPLDLDIDGLMAELTSALIALINLVRVDRGDERSAFAGAPSIGLREPVALG